MPTAFHTSWNASVEIDGGIRLQKEGREAAGIVPK